MWRIWGCNHLCLKWLLLLSNDPTMNLIWLFGRNLTPLWVSFDSFSIIWLHYECHFTHFVGPFHPFYTYKLLYPKWDIWFPLHFQCIRMQLEWFRRSLLGKQSASETLGDTPSPTAPSSSKYDTNCCSCNITLRKLCIYLVWVLTTRSHWKLSYDTLGGILTYV